MRRRAALRRTAEAAPSPGRSRVVLMEVEPHSLLVYWEAAPAALAAARARAGDPEAALVLRLHDASPLVAHGTAVLLEIEAGGSTGELPLRLDRPARPLRAELGVRGRSGSFAALARSNLAESPRADEPSIFEERSRRILSRPSRWRPRSEEASPASPPSASRPPVAGGTDGQAASESAASFPSRGMGTVSGIRVARAPGAEATPSHPREGPRSSPSSPMAGLGAGSSGNPTSGELPPPPDRVEIELHADLVIYGRTRPGTSVFAGGAEIQVRPDGTFELRFALPPSTG